MAVQMLDDALVGGFGLRHAIATVAAAAPDAPALIHRLRVEDQATQTWRYRDLVQQTDAIASAFLAAGIGAAEAVAIIGASLPEFLCAFYAASDVAVAFPVNSLLSAEAMTRQFELAKVTVCVVVGDPTVGGLDTRLATALAALPRLRLLVTTVDAIGALSLLDAPHIGWHDLADEPPRLHASHNPEAVAALFHTGGTSGSPKLAQLSARALLAGPTYAARMLGWRSDDRALNLLPYFHVGGALATATSLMIAGAANVTCGSLGARDPALVADIWQIIGQLEVSVAGLVPTSWAAVASHPLPRMPAPFRAMVTGASSMSPVLRQRLVEAIGVPFCEVYGMTEFAGFCAAQPLDGSIGTPGVGFLPEEVTLTLIDPLGEVALQGPNAFSGYRTVEGTTDAPSIGPIRTGDLGELDEVGQLILRGRIKDVIVRSGHNIDPLAIEDLACAHPKVRQAAAVGQPDAYAGEVPILYVVADDEAAVAEIEHYLRDKIIEAPARPRSVRLLPALPMTNVGKLDRNRLRQLAAIEMARGVLDDEGLESVECTDPAARRVSLTWSRPLTPEHADQTSSTLATIGMSWIAGGANPPASTSQQEGRPA